MHDHHNHHPSFGIHGMFLFGEAPLYLSHLPMFSMTEHRTQAVLEIDVDDDVREALRLDKKTTGDPSHTFVPKPFPLVELDPAGGPVRTTMEGTIFHGHFERGGHPIVEDVIVRITRVTHFSPLDPTLRHDRTAPLSYLCFGRAGQLHLAHRISARPDWDQILDIRLDPPPAEDFQFAVPVTFARPDVPDRMLKPGESAAGVFQLGGVNDVTAQVEVLAEPYLEIAELK